VPCAVQVPTAVKGESGRTGRILKESLEVTSYGTGLVGEVQMDAVRTFRVLRFLVLGEENIWSWALTWVQMGAIDVVCAALDGREDVLKAMMAKIPALRQSSVTDCGQEEYALVSAHLCTRKGMETFFEILKTSESLRRKVVISVPPLLRRVVDRKLKLDKTGLGCGNLKSWRMEHRRLGGLTSGQYWLYWWGDKYTGDIDLGMRQAPERDCVRFLEPSVRLDEWQFPKEAQSGQMDLTGLNYVWMPENGPMAPGTKDLTHVCARSVFFGGRRVIRRITSKEKGQVLDIREDWSSWLAKDFWSTKSPCIPCRIPNEFAVAAVDWLDPSRMSEGKQGDARQLEPPVGYFELLFDSTEALDVTTAARSDTAETDVSMWAVGGSGKGMESARDTIREKLAHRWWKKKILREGLNYLKTTEEGVEHERDKDAVRECVTRSANSTWFDWADGSRLYFWRWPDKWRKEARDGKVAWRKRIPPRKKFTRMLSMDGDIAAKVRSKIAKYIDRRYIMAGAVLLSMFYFWVMKGEDDIRMVWDSTQSGENESVFAPNFFLPSVETLCRRVYKGCYMGDFDVGEMFNNFRLHPLDQPYQGVNLPDGLRGTGGEDVLRWSVLSMGWTCSPYMANRMMQRGLEWAKGPPWDTKSPFAWDRVILNLPGSDSFDPSKPWVMRVTKDGSLAGEIIIFFDDGRVIGRCKAHADACMRWLCSRLQFLGIQDAARKRRTSSQRQGAWAGGVVYTDRGIPRRFLSQKRWDRMQSDLRWLRDEVRAGRKLPRGKFWKVRGFLVYASLTYDVMQPYMKGVHLTAYGWMNDRDSDGWKVSEVDPSDIEEAGDRNMTSDLNDIIREASMEDALECPLAATQDEGGPKDVPLWLEPSTRLLRDVEAMLGLLSGSSPAMRVIRPAGVMGYTYGFGDASGEGYGSGWSDLVRAVARLRRGFWCAEISEKSSNYREFKNLLEEIRDASTAGILANKLVFLFTDNLVAESIFYKGTSSSRELYEMVLELRKLEMKGGFKLKIIHVAGTRMIFQGTDGLSRGELQLGSLLDKAACNVPLHLDPLTRSPALKEWLEDWLGEESLDICSPEDWFYRGHFGGTKIWSLPPAAAIHALEELGVARLKRHEEVSAVILVPALMRPDWFRRFSRIVDVYFVLPAGVEDCWSSDMHEPLIIGLCLPLLRCQPWQWKKSESLVALGRQVSSLYKKGDCTGRDLLRQLWIAQDRARYLPEVLVRKLLSGNSWGRLLRLSRYGRRRETSGRGRG
jgi:hypothetical protein